jgi:hypothetical protein
MVLLKCKFKLNSKRKTLIWFVSYGGAFVECSLQHPTEVEILQLVFRVNEVRSFVCFVFLFKLNFLFILRVHW